MARSVIDGHRLQIPQDTPEPIAKLITACWAANPSDRPPIDEVVRVLEPLVPAAMKSATSDAVEAPWHIPADLLQSKLHWEQQADQRAAGMRFAYLDEKDPVQAPHVARLRRLCGKHVHVTRVALIDNKDLEGRFTYQVSLLQRLCLSTGFRPTASTSPARNALDSQLSLRLSPLPGLRGLGLMFNGTHEKMAWKMCTTGIVNFRKKVFDASLL